MGTRRPTSNAREWRHRENGFSLLEMVTVIALILIMGSMTFMSLIPALKQQRITNAYNTTMAAMRLARDCSVSQRTSYSVTFSNSVSPNTIAVAPTLTFNGTPCGATYQLPTDVTFLAQSGLPNTAATTPDNYYSSALVPIDFGYTANGSTGGSSIIYFCPDGSAQDAENGAGNCLGSWSGGVVYIARSGEILSSRAVTLWGGTGRIHGWRLYPNGGGGYQWLRQ